MVRRFDVLDRHLQVRGTYLLEASAGTGKTFAIEHLVARLLVEEDPLSIGQILVVTFTRAATRELKERIRSNLLAALQALRGKETGSLFDYLQSFLEKGAGDVKRAILRLEEALACFEEAQIFTIHGFCQRMLQAFAFEAGIDFGVADTEEEGYRTWMYQVVRDFLRTGLKEPAYSPRQIEGVLKMVSQDIERLSWQLVDKIEQSSQVPVGEDYATLLGRFQGALSGVVNRHPIRAAFLLEDYEKIAPCYKKVNTPFYQEQVALWASFLEKGVCGKEEFEELIQEEECFLTYLEKDNLKVRAKLPEEDSLHYPGIWSILRKELYPFLQEAQDPRRTFLRMVADCQKAWGEFLQHQDHFSPDALLDKMQRCLTHPGFVERIQQKYQAIIVDEFQDTDPIQWDIFRSLFLDSHKPVCALYLVGDPKQSIYAFRNADVYTYLEAEKILGSENKLALDTNFRSEPALVKALNTLFSPPNIPPWITLPLLNKALAYPQVQYSERAVDQEFHDGKGSLHFFLVEGKSGREKKWPSLKVEEAFLFPFIAEEIARFTQQKLPYSASAILVKDRYQAQRLQEFLRKKKIPSFIKRGSTLKGSLAFPVMRDLLEAVLDPENLSSLKKALGGPLIGWNHEELKGGMEKEEFQQARARFQGFQEKMEERGFGFFFQDFLSSIWKKKRSILEALVLREELSFYHDLKQIEELLLEYEYTHLSQGKTSGAELLTFLMELFQESTEENERLKRRVSEEGDCVTILSTHMSKGLEFDIVFALGLASRFTREEEFVTLSSGKKKQLTLMDWENEHCVKALQEQDAEKMRQLYVALTRAKRRVYIPFIFDQDQKEISLGQAAPIELFSTQLCLPESLGIQAFQNKLEELKKQCSLTYSFVEERSRDKEEQKEEEASLLFAPSSPPLFPRASFRKSFSQFTKKVGLEEEPLLMPMEESAPAPLLPLGAETGVILHTILEKICRQGLYAPWEEEEISSLIRREITGGLLEGLEEEILRMVKEACHLPLGDFALVEIEPKNLSAEMEFVFPLQTSLIKGIIDLVFEKEGRYYLLDWKSNWLGEEEEYQEAAIIKAMQEHEYFLQASLYMHALEKYLSLLDKRPFGEIFGGAIYLFLRGKKAYHFYPDKDLVLRLAEGVI